MPPAAPKAKRRRAEAAQEMKVRGAFWERREPFMVEIERPKRSSEGLGLGYTCLPTGEGARRSLWPKRETRESARARG